MRSRVLYALMMVSAAQFSALLLAAQRDHFTLVALPKKEPAFNVNAMTQDQRGFLWLATSCALYKYDGYQYTGYHNEPLNSNSLAGSNLQCIAADSAGNIWTAPQYNGLDRLDPVSGVFTHFRHDVNDPSSLANDSVWCMLIDHTGIIWLGTNDGLDAMDLRTKKFTHYRYKSTDTTSLCSNTVRVIYEDRAGTIWIGSGNTFNVDKSNTSGGLSRFDRKTGKFTRWQHGEKNIHSLADNRVTAILEDSRGVFWVGTAGDGLSTLDHKTGLIKRHPFNNAQPGQPYRPAVKNDLSYAVDHITFLKEDAFGRIWIGSLENGINVYDPSTGETVYYGRERKEPGQPMDQTFWTACKTRDNQLWIGTWGTNFYKISPYNNQLAYTQVNKTVICAAEDNAHDLWLTTFRGLHHIKNDGTTEVLFTGKKSIDSANRLFFIEKDGDHFWITSDQGLYRFDPAAKSFTLYHAPGNPKKWIADSSGTLKKDTGDILWIATPHGPDRFNTKTGEVKNFAHRPGDSTSISNNLIVTMNTDDKHNLWVGTDKGLNRLIDTSGVFKRYLPAISVIHTYQDSAGIIWAGTSAGLFKYNPQTDNFLNFTDPSGIPAPNIIFWQQEDKAHNLWLSSNTSGIIRLNAARDIATVFGTNQGVKSFALTGFIFLRANGHLIIPDTSGYFDFDPAALEAHTAPAPYINVSNFLLNNQPVLPSPDGLLTRSLDQTNQINLAHHQNTFAFEFSNLDLASNHDDGRLLYRLFNYDAGWHAAEERREAYYFNLPPGKYIFSVKAINVFGIAAEKNITIFIAQPWWQTWWAISIFSLVLVSIGYFLYRNRIRQLQKKQAWQMQTMVAAQEGERKRISRDLHDDVGTKLSALKLFLSSLQEKAVATGNAGVGSLAHTAGQFITEVMQDVRNLLQNLSPAVLEEFGYITAVEGLVGKINQAQNIHFELTTFGIKDRLQKDYELALFRITQELVSNVLKHAEAKNVSLQIGHRDEKIILMIEDDGKGFNAGSHREGYGLHNLAARTKLMNGTMVLDAQPGRGTSVLIEIPYQLQAI